MCHGKNGDGKGELAAEMKLDLHDWRDPKSIANMTDGELFYVVSNGRGKMRGGEGDRQKEVVRWNLVKGGPLIWENGCGLTKHTN